MLFIFGIKIILRFMKKIARIKKKVNNYLFDHIHLRNGLDISRCTFLAIVSAALYAFGFYSFITPYAVDPSTIEGSSITTGGIGGISQVIHLIFTLCGLQVSPHLMQSIFYFALNIPILIFAFFKIGKRFAIITLINVGLSSAFIQIFDHVDLFRNIAYRLQSEHLSRVVFSGVSVGLASAMAFRADVSCGGIDVISYYFAMRKSTSVGKYTAALNSLIILTYTFLTIGINKGSLVEVAFLNLAYSITYLFVSTLVVDAINTRNKKAQVQIITDKAGIESILIANFPHSATTINGVGGYSHKEKEIILMTVSSNEVKRVISLIKKVDEHAFITVTPLIQAYGNFFIRPVE